MPALLQRVKKVKIIVKNNEMAETGKELLLSVSIKVTKNGI
ncbi:MAG: hypothetical protein V1739_04585 [Candidatus Omnitrophota bacterium]